MFRKKKKTTIKRKEIKKEISFEDLLEKIKKILFFFLLISFLGVTFWVLFFSYFVEINNIKVSGFQEEPVIKVAKEVIDSPYLNFIPQNNIILLLPTRIEKEIKENWILAEDVKVEKVFPNTIEISFKEKENVIIWCQEKAEQACFLVDEKGEAFYRINNIAELKDKFPTVYSKGTLDIEIGKLIIKPEMVIFCSEIAEFSLNEAGIVLNNEYHTPSFIAEEIKVQTEQGWNIYFNSSSTAYEQSRLLKSFLEKNIKENDLEKLEYIDLRLDGKVLYKLKEEEKTKDENDNNEPE